MSDVRFRRGRPPREGERRFGGGRFGGGRFERFDEDAIRPQLLPYHALPEDDAERRNALEFVIDLLSTGQYATANVAEDLLAGEWRAPIRGAVTHARRGDWENVLFGGPSSAAGGEAQRGLMPIADEPGGGRRLVRGVGGFVGNVLLDPTTYVSFGATAASKAGARAFAGMAVRQAMRQLADPQVTARIFGARAGRRGLTAAQRRRVIGDVPLNQYRSRVWNDAYREALTTPSSTLRKRYADRLAAEGRNAADTRRALAGNGEAWAKEALQDAEGRVAAVGREMRKVLDDDSWNVGIPGDPEFRGFRALGEGAWKVLGGELLRTGQAGPVRRSLAQVGAAVRRAGREFPVTKFFLDAWWASQTNGVVGAIRNRLGFFRSGYQTMLRNLDLAMESTTQDVARDNVDAVRAAFADKSSEVKNAFTRLVSAVYDRVGETVVEASDAAAQRRALIEATGEALDDPGVRAVVPSGLWDETIDLWSKVRQITDAWANDEAQMAADGFIQGANEIMNYLPIAWRPEPGELPRARKRGGMIFSPLLERKTSFSAQRQREIEQQAAFFGLPGQVAAEIVDTNAGRLVTDAEQLLMGRGIANARMVGRRTLLTQMRALGLNVKEVGSMSGVASALPEAGQTFRHHPDEALRTALVQSYETGNLSHIGLYTVPGEKYLDGWVFDREVRDILQRTVEATGDDLHVIGRALRNYTTWIKGMLTLRPGFHVRNLVSNQAMMFLREGPRAFSMRFLRPGLVGAAHQLRGAESGLTRAADGVLDKLQVKRALQWEFGEYTVAELADWARKHGVISRISKAGDPRDLYGRVKQRSAANPLRWQEAAFEGSKNAGALIESAQRFSLFLMEIDRMARPGLRLTEAELEAATFAARRWMVDYNDLTEFEQRFVKHFVPFYAWMRYNVRNIVEGIVDAPGLYAAAFKSQESLSDFLSGDIEVDYDQIPEWIRDQGSVPVGRGEDGKVILANLGMPWSDLNMFAVTMPGRGELDLPRLDAVELIGELASRAHPTVRSWFEAATGRSLFDEQDLTGVVEVPRALRGLEAAPKVLALLDGIGRVVWSPRGVGFVDAQGRPNEDRRGRLVMDGRAAQILENHLPTLEWLGRALDGPVWMLERAGVAVEEALDDARLGRDDYDNFDEFLRLLSWYAGVSARQIDPAWEPRRRQREREREARRLRNLYSTRQRVRDETWP